MDSFGNITAHGTRYLYPERPPQDLFWINQKGHCNYWCSVQGGTSGSVCPSYVARITKEDVAAFWAAQPFDLGMDSDYGNCDLCWKKNTAKLIRTIQEAPSRVSWCSGTEE